MKMLLATAALVTLFASDALANHGGGARIGPMVCGGGRPSLCTCAFLWSAVALRTRKRI